MVALDELMSLEESRSVFKAGVVGSTAHFMELNTEYMYLSLAEIRRAGSQCE